MMRILLSVAAAAALALVTGNAAEASGRGPSGHSSGHSFGRSYGGYRNFVHRGHSFRSHYYERSYRGWSRYCWFPSYRCYGYYCPTQSCWYYYCGTQSCYLPVSYMSTFAPTPVNLNTNQNQNQNQNTNVNVNVVGGPGLPAGAAPVAVAPPLPVGATPLQAGGPVGPVGPMPPAP